MKSFLCVSVAIGLTWVAGLSSSLAQSIHLNAWDIDTQVPAARSAARAVVAPATGSQLHLVQFDGPIQPEWVSQLEEDGYRMVDFIPDNAYLVYGGASALKSMRSRAQHIQWEGAYLATDKIHPRARPAAVTARRAATGSDVLFSVQLVLDEGSNAQTLAWVDSVKLAPIRSQSVNRQLGFLNVVVALPPERLEEMADRPDVVSIHLYTPPQRCDERQDQINAGNLNADGSQPSGTGYLAWLSSKGFTQEQFDSSSFIVDIADDGWDLGIASTPANPEFRKGGSVGASSRMQYSQMGSSRAESGSWAADGHGNINVSIVGGFNNLAGSLYEDASGYNFGLGVCPFALMGNTKVFADDGSWEPTDEQELAYIDANYARGVRISSDSWGASGAGVYDAYAQSYDTVTRDAQPGVTGNQECLFVFAAGNEGTGGASTIGSPGSAKNIITVGASENYNSSYSDGCDVPGSGADNANDIIDFSSRGPCSDDRTKPDIVAPGTHIQGAASFYPGYTGNGVCDKYMPAGQTNYASSSGTSHSTPAVAGGAALVRQYFINQGWTVPSPAMVKIFLMNSARYLTGVDANDNLWSNDQGMGGMNLGTAFDGNARILRDQLTNDLFTASGQSRKFYGIVSDTNKSLRVTLGWTDAPGSTTGNAYKNNLDLTVVAGGVTYKGNVFSGAYSASGGAADVRNNVESVFLPAGVTGLVQVTVTGFNINSDGVPNYGGSLDQDFALVVANASAFTPSNYPPDLSSIGNKAIATNQLLQFTVYASDSVDGDSVRLWATGVPEWATFDGATNVGEVSCLFAGTAPSATGTFSVTFYAADKDGTNTQAIAIEVNDCVSAAILNEGFAAGATAPAGWTFSGISETYTSVGNYGLSSPALKLDSTGDQLVTPVLNSPTNLQFWIKGQGTDSSSALLVESYNGSAWSTVQNLIPLPAIATTQLVEIAEGMTQIRFTYTKSSGNLAFDDVLVGGCAGGSAPNFPPVISVDGGTSQGAILNEPLSFTVSVSDADGESVGLFTNLAPVGADFPEVVGPAPLQSTFTWTPQETGTFAAAFVAFDASVAVTQAVSITVGASLPQLLAPVVQAATDVQPFQFRANWLASSNATGYRLDVATNASFSVGGLVTNLTEDFSLFVRTNSSTDISSGLDSYMHMAGWAGSKVFEDAGMAKLGSASAKGYLTTPVVDLSGNGGTVTVKFDLKRFGTDSSAVQLMHAPDGTTYSQVGADITPPVSTEQQSFTITNGTALSKVRITGTATSKNRFWLDNVQITQGASSRRFVPGFESRDVGDTTTYVVTGLMDNVTYYYRVKAYNAISNSAFSGTTNVTTVAGVDVPPVLNPIGNQSITVGSNLQFQVTATPTDGDAVTLTASNLPPGSTFNPTNENGTFQWIGASPTGAYSVTFYATDENGADEETVSITVGEAVTELLAPVIQAASDIQANHFNANWLASSGATGYRLDVGMNDNFSGGGGGDATTNISENIQSWTVHGGYGTWTQSIPAGTVNMTQCIVTPSAAASGAGSVGRVQLEGGTGILELPALDTVGTVTMVIAAGGSSRTAKLQKYNGSAWVDLATWTGIGTAGAAFTNDVNDSGSSVRLRLASPSSAIYVHDILVTSLGGGSSGFVPGYENCDVGNVTTVAVTGLMENVTYHYRIKAYNASSNSPYSGTTSVVTTASSGTPPVLNPIGGQSVFVGYPLEFHVSATATEGDAVTLTASNLPAGAFFYPTNELGTFSWNSASPTGEYSVVFYAADKDGSDGEAVGIYVVPLPEVGAFVMSNGATASATFLSVSDQVYRMEFTTNLMANPVVWDEAATETGTGGAITLTDDDPADPSRYYRLTVPSSAP